MLYAEMRGIKLSNQEDEDAIIADIEHNVGAQPDKCDCGKRIKDDDRMCWWCGGDVAPEGSDPGGYERLVEEWKAKGGKVILDEPPVEKPVKQVAAAEEPAEKKEKEVEAKQKKSLKLMKPVETEEPAEAVVEEAPTSPAKRGDMTLAQRIKEVKALSKQTGASAWEIGKHLYTIQKNALWKEKTEYETWEDFCKQEFGFTRMTANNFIRISQKFDHAECKKLGLFHLIALSDSRLSDKDRERLYEQADQMDTSEVKAAVQEAVAEDRKAKGEPEPEPKKKRTKSPYQSMVGSTVEGRYNKDDQQKAVLQLDDLVGLELKLLKTKITAKFISLAVEEDVEE